MHLIHGKAERIRHFRKYAVGDLKDQSFWFHGPAPEADGELLQGQTNADGRCAHALPADSGKVQ